MSLERSWRLMGLPESEIERLMAQRQVPERALLLGEARISSVEIVRYENHWDYILRARVWALLEDAHDRLVAPTFPVHDEPMEVLE